MPELQTVSNSSSSETYPSDSDSDSDDDVSRLGRYLRSAASTRYGELPDQLEVQRGEDEEARVMQEIAERGPEAAGPPLDAGGDEPHMPIMDYENPTPEDEVDRGRVTNPPFLTDGRGRVVWSSDGGTGELVSSRPRPSAEMEAAGSESQTKRNGLSGS
jgi:E3 ubiquitin-protein ligase makorin